MTARLQKQRGSDHLKDSDPYGSDTYRGKTFETRYPNIALSSSTAPVTDRGRTPRSGTISSNHSVQSGRSGHSVHPFASARSPSPSSRPILEEPLAISKDRRKASLPLHSAYSHPNLADAYKMASPPTHQVAIVSSEEISHDEETCPVCCESLSFTFRLPGEKPHVQPECGHALHYVRDICLDVHTLIRNRNASSPYTEKSRGKDQGS